MQDNSPIHKARIVTQWFEEQQNITLFHWPSKGCDLNPIENVWGNIVRTWEPEQERYRKQFMSYGRVSELKKTLNSKIRECKNVLIKI